MPRTAEEILEFDKLRDILRRRTTCAPGRRAVDALGPSRDRARLEAAFALIREAMAYLRAGNELGFGALADPQTWLGRLEGPGAVLTPAEVLDAASLAETTGWLKQQFREEAAKFPLLAARAASLADFRGILGAIRRAVLPNGEISDDASALLKRIRATIGKTRESIQKTLKQVLRARGAEAGEDYVTLRNDRFVIPVRATERREVQGVMHGSSGTGQTVFIEPFQTVEMNNQLVQLGEDEAAEIARILHELTERLQMQMGPFEAAAAAIAELDAAFARARFAREFDCAIPEFAPANEGAGELRLDAARHPVLEERLRREGRAVVPMTLALGGEETVLVISGPNTGGKTVALKTVGLASLAAQSGIPVAAERAVLPLVDRVLADIGGEQSIGADLPAAGGRPRGLERDCHRQAAWNRAADHRASDAATCSGDPRSRRVDRLSAPRPRRTGPDETADERADAATRRGKEKAADGMGGAAEEAPGGTGAEVRGDAETLRAGNCPRSRSGEGARAACATRKASPPKDGWRPQRRARGSEHGRRAAS